MDENVKNFPLRVQYFHSIFKCADPSVHSKIKGIKDLLDPLSDPCTTLTIYLILLAVEDILDYYYCALFFALMSCSSRSPNNSSSHTVACIPLPVITDGKVDLQHT